VPRRVGTLHAIVREIPGIGMVIDRGDCPLPADRPFIIDKLEQKANPVPAIGRATSSGAPGRIRR
jgi:hypothetical protein